MRFVGLDPSTKTGYVVINEHGELLQQMELEGIGGEDPTRMYSLVKRVSSHIQKGDVVAIEGFGFASQTGFLLGGIGWGIRMALFGRGIGYVEVAPAALKKFTGAGGNAAKEVLAVEVFKRWGFQHKSNNVTDAFVLAHIARALHIPVSLIKPQQEVLQVIRNPVPKTNKKKG